MSLQYLFQCVSSLPSLSGCPSLQAFECLSHCPLCVLFGVQCAIKGLSGREKQLLTHDTLQADIEAKKKSIADLEAAGAKVRWRAQLACSGSSHMKCYVLHFSYPCSSCPWWSARTLHAFCRCLCLTFALVMWVFHSHDEMKHWIILGVASPS